MYSGQRTNPSNSWRPSFPLVGSEGGDWINSGGTDCGKQGRDDRDRGFHLVAAQDSVIEKAVAALHDTYKVERIAPGHCSGEHTFSAVKQTFGDKYQYAGVGTVVQLRAEGSAVARR